MGAPVVISILADARDAVRGFRDTSNAAQTMGGKVKGASKAMTGPALAALGGLGAGLFSAAQQASELGDAIDANKVIFKNASGDIQKFAATAATSFGLSKQVIVDAANSIGTFGKAAGLTGKGLSGFTTDLISRAGDVASMYGGTASQAVEAFGAALRGETEGVRQYGVLLNEGSIKATAMSLGLVKATGDADKIAAAQTRAKIAQADYNKVVKEHGKGSLEAQKAQAGLTAAQNALDKATKGTVPELTAQQKVLATQRAILEQTSVAQGNFADTSSSAKNQQEILKAQLENTTAELGTSLLPALSGTVKALSGMVGWISQNKGVAAGLAITVGGLAASVLAVNAAFKVAAAGQLAWGAATKATAAIQTAARAVQAAWTAGTITGTIATTAQAVATKVAAAAQAVWTGIQAAFNVVMAMNPISLIIIAIVALVAVFVIAYKKCETFRNIVNAAWAGIKKAAVAVFGFLSIYFKTVFNIYATIFRWVIAQVKNAWAGIQVLATIAVAVFNRVRSAVAAVVGWVVGQFQAAVGRVRAVWAGITSVVTTIFNVRDRIIGAFLGIAAKLYNVGSSIVAGLRNGIVNAWGMVTSAIREKVNLIPEAIRKFLGIKSPSTVTARIGEQIVAGLTKGLKAGTPALLKQTRVIAGTIETGVAAAAPVADLALTGTTGGTGTGGTVVNVTVNVPPSADPVAVGRAIERVLRAYETGTGRTVLMPA